MKKMYNNPTTETVELLTANVVLAGSPGGGGSTPPTPNPEDGLSILPPVGGTPTPID